MREKLNENPVAQIVLVAVLALVVGYLVLGGMGGGESSSSSTSEEATATTTTVEEGSEASSLASVPAAATTAVSAPSADKVPVPITAAYNEGKLVVLLVYRKGGIDDKLVRDAASSLDAVPSVAFFPVQAKEIAHYSAITGPLGVSGTPALVVVRPRTLNNGAPAPATVDYGFRSGADVLQAVIDAGYTGPQLSYAPK